MGARFTFSSASMEPFNQPPSPLVSSVRYPVPNPGISLSRYNCPAKKKQEAAVSSIQWSIVKLRWTMVYAMLHTRANPRRKKHKPCRGHPMTSPPPLAPLPPAPRSRTPHSHPVQPANDKTWMAGRGCQLGVVFLRIKIRQPPTTIPNHFTARVSAL